MFRLDISDYKAWAYGLKAAGYATNPNYPQLLLKIIEEHKLYVYDSIGLNLKPVFDTIPHTLVSAVPAERAEPEHAGVELQRYSNGPSDRQVFLLNGVKCIVAQQGDTYIALSVDFRLKLDEIYHFNDLTEGAMLKPGDVVYIQRKAKNAQRDFHIVGPGETLQAISQLYGIRLSMLERRNSLSNNEKLVPGSKIRLNSKRD